MSQSLAYRRLKCYGFDNPSEFGQVNLHITTTIHSQWTQKELDKWEDENAGLGHQAARFLHLEERLYSKLTPAERDARERAKQLAYSAARYTHSDRTKRAEAREEARRQADISKGAEYPSGLSLPTKQKVGLGMLPFAPILALSRSPSSAT